MAGEICPVETQTLPQWRFTWEAQSHIPTLRLFLFDSRTNPSLRCRDLRVDVNLVRSVVLVTWSEGRDISLRVPIPRVLIDGESPVSFAAFEDHIEVKLVLLLPVGHPIVSSLDSILNSSFDEGTENSDSSKSLSVSSDIRRLSSSGGVHFYCRNCTFILTKALIREFLEKPSVNWREVADNWFGTCCCSFGGISEKLVARFANSYTCAQGVCLLDFATVTICKDDLVEFNFTSSDTCQSREAEKDLTADNRFCESTLNSCAKDHHNGKSELTTLDDQDHEECSEYVASGIGDELSAGDGLSQLHSESNYSTSDRPSTGCCTHHVSETLQDDKKFNESVEILENQKSFVNGFLGNVFMVRSSNLSKDVEWVEYKCPQCSNLLGAYPCANGSTPVDGGVRLFKCYISTDFSPSKSGDLFSLFNRMNRNYSLERMFTNQLLEIAKDELSYRTVIRDLKTKGTMLQVVIVNTNSWLCTGYCSTDQCGLEAVTKMDLQPVIKVLFTECCSEEESQWTMEDQINKGLVDEIFMLRRQLEETIKSLFSQRNTLPASYSSLQGLLLSSMKI